MQRRLLTLVLLTVLGHAPQHSMDAEQERRFKSDDTLVQAVVGPRKDGTWVVPTTQIIRSAGKTVLFPGRPVSLALSPDGATLAVKNTTNVIFFDIRKQSITQTLWMRNKNNRSKYIMKNSVTDASTFCGIAFSADGRTVWATTAQSFLVGASRGTDGIFQWRKEIQLPGPEGGGDSAPGGLALDSAQGLAYVTLSRNNTLAVVDLASGRIVDQVPVGIAPYDLRLMGGKAYVTNWGGRRPRRGDLTGPTSGSLTVITPAGIPSTGTVSVINLSMRRNLKDIEVELHPSGMALSPDGHRLYVANANSDTISVIDLDADSLIARWVAKPMRDLPLGSAPNALAVSPDGKCLYAALGGNNCLAVINTASGAVTGLIPTGWYPGDLCLSGDDVLSVANTKGVGSRLRDYDPAANGPWPHISIQGEWVLPKIQSVEPVKGYSSFEALGSISFIPTPTAEQLKQYTYQAGANMRLPRMADVLKIPEGARRPTAVPTRPGETSLFKHVIYIIKENRTYDQVFGDLPQGDGDPSLLYFGRRVTPNHHALAEEFVLLDNFYCNGVVSYDGHQWATEGFVTDYLEKSFGGWPRGYDTGGDALAFASSGSIWDHVLKAGLTFRNYGEMVDTDAYRPDQGSAPKPAPTDTDRLRVHPVETTWNQIYSDFLSGERKIKFRNTAEVRSLEPYTCPTFPGWLVTVPDVYRAEEFLKELRQFEVQGSLPNFIIMSLIDDHTQGTGPGFPTPSAMVASDDLAVGRIVEAISRSQFWRDTVIFVVEDDPSSGLDHVDGHRTVALCISPYTRRGVVNHTFYNQTSMLRTIELILGLQPLTQLTMLANPMVNCFTDRPDLAPYRCRPNNIPLDEMNPPLHALRGKQRYYAKKSTELPLREIDRAEGTWVDRILWHAVKGYDVPYPTLKSAHGRAKKQERGLPSEM